MHTIDIPRHIVERALARRQLRHPYEDLNPARTALVVVDLQNGFMAPGRPAEIPAARDIVPNVNRIGSALREAGGTVIFIQHTVDADTLSGWSTYFEHLLSPERGGRLQETFRPGSAGHDLWPGLHVDPRDLKFMKRRFSVFVPGSSDLHPVLQARGIDTLIVTGTATNMCCESTARDAMMMNYRVIFSADGTATHSDVEHNGTLGNMMFFCDVMTSEEIVKCISRPAERRQEYAQR
jgi:ureidoacrylate peracid hydrolase